MSIVAAWFLVACGPGQEPLREARAVAWRPADGQVLVICEDGQRIRCFDALLRPVDDRWLAAPVVAAAASGGRWLLRDAAGNVSDLAGSAVDASPDFLFQDGLAGPGPGARRFSLDPARGVLELGPAPWEHGGEIEWGPGWAALRVRSARVLGAFAEWRVEGQPSRLASWHADRDDPLLQVAWLEPVATGTRLEVRFRPPQPSFPEPPWTAWRGLAVPAVEPAGARPVSVLPPAGPPPPDSLER